MQHTKSSSLHQTKTANYNQLINPKPKAIQTAEAVWHLVFLKKTKYDAFFETTVKFYTQKISSHLELDCHHNC